MCIRDSLNSASASQTYVEQLFSFCYLLAAADEMIYTCKTLEMRAFLRLNKVVIEYCRQWLTSPQLFFYTAYDKTELNWQWNWIWIFLLNWNYRVGQKVNPIFFTVMILITINVRESSGLTGILRVNLLIKVCDRSVQACKMLIQPISACAL